MFDGCLCPFLGLCCTAWGVFVGWRLFSEKADSRRPAVEGPPRAEEIRDD